MDERNHNVQGFCQIPVSLRVLTKSLKLGGSFLTSLLDAVQRVLLNDNYLCVMLS